MVRASVWLAVACYVVSALGQRIAPRGVRLVWTAGCGAFLVHVASAFHVHYNWSHVAALEHTARRTAELTGWAFGGGLYANYLFAALWLADVLWWWLAPASYRRRSGAIDLGLHAYLLFMVFNGAVVFARGPVRWLGLAATLVGIASVIAAYRSENR